MAVAAMAVLANAVPAVDGGGGNGGLCQRRSLATEAEVRWSQRRQWGCCQQQRQLMAVAAMALFPPPLTTTTTQWQWQQWHL